MAPKKTVQPITQNDLSRRELEELEAMLRETDGVSIGMLTDEDTVKSKVSIIKFENYLLWFAVRRKVPDITYYDALEWDWSEPFPEVEDDPKDSKG